jgi:hypothetical protein
MWTTFFHFVCSQLDRLGLRLIFYVLSIQYETLLERVLFPRNKRKRRASEEEEEDHVSEDVCVCYPVPGKNTFKSLNEIGTLICCTLFYMDGACYSGQRKRFSYLMLSVNEVTVPNWLHIFGLYSARVVFNQWGIVIKPNLLWHNFQGLGFEVSSERLSQLTRQAYCTKDVIWTEFSRVSIYCTLTNWSFEKWECCFLAFRRSWSQWCNQQKTSGMWRGISISSADDICIIQRQQWVYLCHTLADVNFTKTFTNKYTYLDPANAPLKLYPCSSSKY